MREELYRNLTTDLKRRLPAASKPQVQILALLTQALVFSQDCNMPDLALELPIAGQRESLIQRLDRFLDNSRLSRRVHYLPLSSRWDEPCSYCTRGRSTANHPSEPTAVMELNFIALFRLDPVDHLPGALADPCLCVTAAQAVTP